MPYDRDKLRELTEKIQVGDTEEGADAVAEIFDLVRDQGANRESVRDAMHAEFRNMKFKAENDAALDRFTKKYPSIASDSVLADAASGVIKRHIVEDLRKAGVEEQELASVRDDVHRLADLHGKARIMGLDVRGAESMSYPSPLCVASMASSFLVLDVGLQVRSWRPPTC
jgi:hypothetical protein